MSLSELALVCGALIFVIGLAAHLVTRDVIRRIVSLNVASGGVMMILLALAIRGSEATPDAVPQALVLTGIVIMAAITALALALARRVRREGEETGEPQESDEPETTQEGAQ